MIFNIYLLLLFVVLLYEKLEFEAYQKSFCSFNSRHSFIISLLFFTIVLYSSLLKLDYKNCKLPSLHYPLSLKTHI